MAFVRIPISAPFERTSSGTRPSGVILSVGIDRDGRAANIIAVQALTGVAVKLGLASGAQHDTRLWACHRRLGAAGISRRIAQHALGRTLFGFEEADINVVVAALHSDADLLFKAAKPPITRMICVEPAQGSVIKLVELVADALWSVGMSCVPPCVC
jgi:hypothetical protein